MSNLKEGEDYYVNDNGMLVFTAAYHLKRGSCCGNGCLHCPYKMPEPPLTPPKEGNYRSEDGGDL
jgi:Family of unknown function (DUF5522)